MTLTLKTYKGYDKQPYCSTHVPTEKYVTISPEAERLKKNTGNQSGFEYTSVVGGFTDKTISPESERLKLTGTGPVPTPFPTMPDLTPSPHMPGPTPVPPMTGSGSQRYVALYDYTAGDDDEISFNEGDIIVDVTVIDEGWMTGTNERTGQHGMIPSNYVELQ